MTGSFSDDELRTFLTEWATAERRGSVPELRRLLSADFVGVGPKGLVRDRDQWLDRYRSGAVRNTVFALSEPEVRIHGEVAIVVVGQHQRSTNQGRDASGRFRFSLVVVREDGTVRLASAHASPDTFAPAHQPTEA